MASEEEIQEESQSGPCLVCCSVRSASVGVATGAVLGLFVGGAADIALARKGAFRWNWSTFRKAEAMSSAFLLGAAVSLPMLAYLSTADPTSNKGCDTSMPYWSWNGARAGTVAAPFAAAAWYFNSVSYRHVRTFSYVGKCFIGALIPGVLFGGLLLQDFWRLAVLDRVWGDKCLPPHSPRTFPPVDEEN